MVNATRNKKLLGTKGIATRSKDSARGSWPYYVTRSKDATIRPFVLFFFFVSTSGCLQPTSD